MTERLDLPTSPRHSRGLAPPTPAVASFQVDASTGDLLAGELATLAAVLDPWAATVALEARSALDSHLVGSLGSRLRSLRHHEGPAALVIDGLPFVEDPGPTPVDGTPTDDRCPIAKAVVNWIAERMGVFLCGYPNIADGRFFHDVNPVRATKRPLSSKGADLALPLHSDSASNDDRPDYLLLWSIRPAPSDRVVTTYAAIGDALRLLAPATIERLRSPSFRLQTPTIADVKEGDEQWSQPVAIVSGPEAAPELRLHATRTECLDSEAETALAELVAALAEVTVDIPMEQGRLLVISNRRGVHGRNGFTPTYGTDERWLLRSYLMIDPWSRRDALIEGRALSALTTIGGS
ncbi:MAG: TauD/TfdA family dioxygenase [Acidimicrobiales bacterium]